MSDKKGDFGFLLMISVLVSSISFTSRVNTPQHLRVLPGAA
jgi:hypothetical protein